jgi:hypothetical protein
MDTDIPEAKDVAAAIMISRTRSLVICSEMIWLSFDGEYDKDVGIMYDGDADAETTLLSGAEMQVQEQVQVWWWWWLLV